LVAGTPGYLASPASRRLTPGPLPLASRGHWSRPRRLGARASSTVWWAFAFRPAVPAPLRGPVVPVVASAVRGDLEVLAVLLVSSLPPQRHDVLSQLIPVKVEPERIKEESLRDEVVKHEHADLFEEMRQQDVIVLLQLLFQKTPKIGSSLSMHIFIVAPCLPVSGGN
jgi:hypothetical protein